MCLLVIKSVMLSIVISLRRLLDYLDLTLQVL
ncbi:hypothetical protein chp1p02 [Chlamydiamicrovirus Chp1]|uniref:Uncharacterized protein ORF7 n=1 Tax=Chlamydia phage 1 TaxID=2003327 RepID=ORF7_BPCHP|nr:hypothetical protein chp1p02 [Chlamydiamicrovirus Chp1]P19187.1 RecName: Full=Uncharacterized protein ORF7 [Chlamydiamicrovirus Chp1]pir/JU0351/ 3.6K protein - Chlamydophila psittaci phage Chp1 [Chlamydiamicrovirus Chp1]BAA00504.1 unnamed protein product [Chlamydiamicrovirus Chp1]